MNLISKILDKLLSLWTPSYNARVRIVFGALLVYVAAIVFCTTKTVVINRPHYTQLVENLQQEVSDVSQLRGVIYSESGEMIAASLPKYDIFFDFRNADEEHFKTVTDTINGKVKKTKVKCPLLPQDTINYYFRADGPTAQWMHKMAPYKSAAQHAADLKIAFRKRARRYLAMRTISYLDFQELKRNVPFFTKSWNRIGCFAEERPFRYRPFGEHRMASATIGGVFSTDTLREVDGEEINYKGHGRNGLEQTFDSLLSGQPGKGVVQWVRRKRTVIVEEDPVDGADVYTTLDMNMQQVLDYELNKRIVELGAAGGWAAVMETKTGKIKAISNLKREGDACYEDYDHFVQDCYDPGSTFKTVSYMILLDDGKIKPDTKVDTENYPGGPYRSWNYHGKEIRDDHPVGEVTAQEAMAQSSNISLAKLTTQAYDKDPQEYLDKIDDMKIFSDMHLNREFQGARVPLHRKVGDKSWSKVSLGQISYGYETAIPGMYMLNFYNAIANDGKLMRPYIVDRVVKDGKVLYQQDPEVINSSICKSSTLKNVRRALEDVVNHGTARTDYNSNGVITKDGAASLKVKIAGKTGTAQRYANHSYSGNGFYVSFAGYFPADDPQYTCIVVIDIRPGYIGGKPGGGYMAGPVFRNFAEQIYASSCYRKVKEIVPDSASIENHGMYPRAKRGPEGITSDVISELNLNKHTEDMSVHAVGLNDVKPGRVPDVTGMGAIDALYMLESAGLNVSISGKGRVVSQSMPAGSSCQRGQTIGIVLK